MIFDNEDLFQLAVNADLRKLNIPFRHRSKSKSLKGQAKNVFTINGVRMAWLDLIIYLPDGETVFCELKHGRGKPSEEQNNFIDHFSKLGYRCFRAWDWDDWEFVKNVIGVIK